MDLFSKIVESYPELNEEHFNPRTGVIGLQDDGDGIQYIAKWDYSKPIPESLKLGK